MKPIHEFYIKAFDYVCDQGYFAETEYFRTIKPLHKQNSVTFFQEYVWTVLNAGMKEQIARKICDRFMEKLDLSTIGHLGKRKAIKQAIDNYEKWFEELKESSNKIEYLETLPWIGPITKYHLARNLGIETVKPDVHLTRLAKQFGYETPLKMCQDIKEVYQEPLGYIDLILWRYCNLTTSKLKIMEES